MKAFKKRPATYQDLQTLPETLVGELIDSELIASPRPSPQHADVAGGILEELRGPFQGGRGGPGGWWILIEPELHLGKDVVIPDLAGFRKTRLPALPSKPFIDLAPDWVCEILSSSTAGFDRVKKLPLSLREGVGHVWLVDPAHRTIEALRRSDEAWILAGSYEGSARVAIEPFEAREFDLSTLWRAE